MNRDTAFAQSIRDVASGKVTNPKQTHTNEQRRLDPLTTKVQPLAEKDPLSKFIVTGFKRVRKSQSER